MTHTEGPRRGPTNHSRGSKGQSPERPTDARRLLIYRPLVGRTKRIYSSSPTSRQGWSSPIYTPLCPPVVRSFAPSTGGYDSSDRKRSLCNRYMSARSTTDAQIVRPYRSRIKGYSVVVLTGTDARPCVPTTGYTSCRTTTDAQIVRPYRTTSCRTTTDAIRLDTSRASLLGDVGGRSNALTGTDARPCVPTTGYTSGCLQHRVLVVVECLGDVEGRVL